MDATQARVTKENVETFRSHIKIVIHFLHRSDRCDLW